MIACQVPGRYQWSDENTVIYTNWGAGQPDNPAGGCVNVDTNDGTWVNTDCAETHFTLCKISTSRWTTDN